MSHNTSATDTSLHGNETSISQDFHTSHSDDLGLHLATLSYRLILLLRSPPHIVPDRHALPRSTPWSYDGVDPITDSEASVW